MRELQDENDNLRASCQKLKQQVAALEDEAINKDITIMKMAEDVRSKSQVVDKSMALEDQVMDQVSGKPEMLVLSNDSLSVCD